MEKITSEHFLIGNQNQIDLVFIGGVVGNFIDTESLWELNISKPIKNLAIDSKSNFILMFVRGSYRNRINNRNRNLSLRQQEDKINAKVFGRNKNKMRRKVSKIY